MRKGSYKIILWTLALAIPFTALSVGILIFLNDVLPGIVRSLFTRVDWRGLAVEGSARWPEVAGMIIGLIVILAIIPIARTISRLRQNSQ
jgi:hypothetical protein